MGILQLTPRPRGMLPSFVPLPWLHVCGGHTQGWYQVPVSGFCDLLKMELMRASLLFKLPSE